MKPQGKVETEVWVTQTYRNRSGKKRKITMCVSRPGASKKEMRAERKQTWRNNPEWAADQKRLAHELVRQSFSDGVSAWFKMLWIQRRPLLSRIGEYDG